MSEGQPGPLETAIATVTAQENVEMPPEVPNNSKALLEPVNLDGLDEETLDWRKTSLDTFLQNLRDDAEKAEKGRREAEEALDDARTRVELAETNLQRAQEGLRASEAGQKELEADSVRAAEELKKTEDAIVARQVRLQAERLQNEEDANLLKEEEARLAVDLKKIH